MPQILNFECDKGMKAGCKHGVTACAGFREDGSRQFCNHLRVKV